MKFLLYILLMIATFSNTKLFSQYVMDQSFGNDGIRKIILSERNTRGKKIIMLDDGSMIVGINSSLPQNGALLQRDFYIYKLDKNGHIDLSFGTNGYYHQPYTSYFARVTYFFSMDYSSYDNNIYIISTIDDVNTLLRINTNGILDTNFGNNGYLSLDGLYTNIVIQDDGKILLAGMEIHSPNEDYKLIRLHHTGNVDTDFGVNGIVVLNPTTYADDEIFQVKLQEDGRIVTAGRSIQGNGIGKAVICRFNTDGSLDTTFGNNGINVTDVGPENIGAFYALDINIDGEIIAAGHALYAGGTGGFYGSKAILVKYKKNGDLDFSFAGTGIKVLEPVFGANDTFRSVIFTKDNHIIAGGNSGSLFPDMQTYYYLAMVDETGNPNPNFFNSGVFTTNFVNSETNYVFDITKNNEGDIISTGISETGYFERFFQAVVCKMTQNPLSIDEFDSKVKVFPNPVHNKLYIEDRHQIKEITIYSITGRILYNEKTPNLSNKKGININLPAGVYHLEIIDKNNRRYIQKFIKK